MLTAMKHVNQIYFTNAFINTFQPGECVISSRM